MIVFQQKIKMALCFLCISTNIFMSADLKNNWFMLRLLLLINAILICVILLMHNTIQHSNNDKDSERSIKDLSVDAVNSITIKLM